jgi:hypothetical protein
VNNSSSKIDSLYFLILILDLMNYCNSSLFYTADLESLLDFSMKRLESTTTDVIREVLLNLLERTTFYPGYDKSNYKKSQLVELIENHLDSDLILDEHKTICEKILDYLNGKK